MNKVEEDTKEVMIMRKVLVCWNSARGSLVLAAVLGMLAIPGSALAGKCGNGVCQGDEPTTCPQDCGGGGAGDDESGFKDIPVCITLDAAGGVMSNGGDYCDSKKDKITAFVGRNRMIVGEIGERSDRMLSLNLGGSIGCGCSTEIDLDGDDMCDVPTDCVDDADPDIPSPSLINGVRFEINIGEDLDDLPMGCSHEDNATLSFTDGDNNWVLRWGSYESFGGAGHCPDSGSIKVTRDNHNTWSFLTTGAQLACLYCENGPADTANEYHGQFHIPFSGHVSSQGQTALSVSCPSQDDNRRGRTLLPPPGDCGLIACP